MTLRTLLRSLLGAAALATLASATPAAAQFVQFQVSATVARVCTIQATPITFGAYDPVVTNATAASPVPATGTVTVQCTRGQTYRVSLDDGLNLDQAALPGRSMGNGASAFLAYELFSDSGYGTAWNTANQVTGTAANRAPVDLTVYARLPGGQDVPVGTYTDTVTADIHL